MDNLLKNFAEYLFIQAKALTRTQFQEVSGHTYYSGEKPVEIFPAPVGPEPPLPAALQVGSLAAAVQLIGGGLESAVPDKLLLQVLSPTEVTLFAKQADAWGRRQTLVKLTMPAYQGFTFNKYMDHEDFCVALQQHFVPLDSPAAGNDFDYVAGVSATMSASAVTISENDGISQTVSLKRSVTSGLKSFADLRRVVTLAPWRTFVEVPQPASPFIFRAKDMGAEAIPNLALFECDGGRWRRLAMTSIKEYLKDQMTASVDIQIVS